MNDSLDGIPDELRRPGGYVDIADLARDVQNLDERILALISILDKLTCEFNAHTKAMAEWSTWIEETCAHVRADAAAKKLSGQRIPGEPDGA